MTAVYVAMQRMAYVNLGGLRADFNLSVIQLHLQMRTVVGRRFRYLLDVLHVSKR